MREEKRKSEAQHQSAVMKWSQQPSIRQRWPCLCLLHHIPNGGRRDPIEARHLKEQGVKPGVPDLCLPVPRGRFHGLYIELKTQRGHATPEQEWWGRASKSRATPGLSAGAGNRLWRPLRNTCARRREHELSSAAGR